MNILQILLISVGLAADAFAVSVIKGLSIKNISLKDTFKLAICFGLFQGIMPAIGYLLGSTFPINTPKEITEQNIIEVGKILEG